jgi:hypothetical protein
MSFSEKTTDTSIIDMPHNEKTSAIENAFNSYTTTALAHDTTDNESVFRRFTKCVTFNTLFLVLASFITGLYIGYHKQTINDTDTCLLKLVGNATEGKARLVFREGAEYLLFKE